ncbi:MAG: hypothetical protein OIF32_01525 [Campylobacterales bacterium]|nr:hypothetical protein [Campylobacterales bacterium]
MDDFGSTEIIIEILTNTPILAELAIVGIVVYLITKLLNVDFHKRKDFRDNSAIQDRIKRLKETEEAAKNAQKNMKMIREAIRKRAEKKRTN